MNSTTDTMQVIELAAFGGADQLRLARRSQPQPAEHEVLIRVHAAGVNRPDIVQRQGHYPPPPGASDILGLEVAGEIVACGVQVNEWRPGDQVCALLSGGGYAEYAVAPAGQCLPLPTGFSFVEAAALPETFFTVWQNVFQIARLQAGEVLLVHGGAGGIGSTAIQLGVAMGARVFATAGTEEKCAFCHSLGAEQAYHYRKQDFVDEIKHATAGLGANVILDMVGGNYIARNIKAAAVEGRIAMIAFLAGAQVELNFMPVLLKRLQLTGCTLRPQAVTYKRALACALYEHVWPLLAEGRVKPYIYKVWPLAQTAEAHRTMESGRHHGKLVLQILSS